MSSSKPKRTRKSLPATNRAPPTSERKRRRTMGPKIDYDKQAMEQLEELQKSIAEAEQFELIIEPESVAKQRRIDEENAERSRVEEERRKIIDTIKKSAKTKDKEEKNLGPNDDGTPERSAGTPTRAGKKQVVPRRLSFDPEENEKRTPAYKKEAAKENQSATSKRKRRSVNYNQEE
ncbi:hypothetical protein WR25_09572 [Diploscapter pachys]|uniref:Uncharacterized protein n=1 Tax=Diploscapter pachys TaxID=2018661 RepID=A0A2A2KXM9_9BILA|nr:hypothetical protein WR25_09572 [Diploscapter pachys]